MKIKDIKNFEIGNHCYGDIIKVNGIDYDNLSNDDILEFIKDMFENNINSSSLIQETFKSALELLNCINISSESDACDQCGNWNHHDKYEIKD